MKTFNYIVVGSGIAGLTFALKAAEKGSVAIVTKRSSSDSNTAWAQGGIACVASSEDSLELHVRDTLVAGDGLCDEHVVRTILSEGPSCVQELINTGMHFDERFNEQGARELDLGREGGHSKRRVLHARDATGLEIEKTLLASIAAHPNITLLENHMAIDLITTQKLGEHATQMEPRCLGLYVLDEDHDKVETLRTDVTLLATGGCGKAYLYTTNPSIATGDGVAMAWRAGAAIANMEFMQFHPTCLFHPKAKSFLISEAVRGEGAILLNSARERFMERYDARLELAPRDIVARAIDAEMKKRGDQCVYLDISHQPATFLQSRFPSIYETCLRYGIDMSKEAIPVVPAAHYQCGGIKTDLSGATSLAGLYAVGEAACTGLHGANRLASNSLLEALVMAHRAEKEASSRTTSFIRLLSKLASGDGRASRQQRQTASRQPEGRAVGQTASQLPGAAGAQRKSVDEVLDRASTGATPQSAAEVEFRKKSIFSQELPPWCSGKAQDPDELVVITHNWDEIRRLMWDYVGIVRTNKRLQRAATRLKNLETEIQEFYWNFKVSVDLLELRNLVTTASLIVHSALQRKESRGLHFTLDYPQHEETFLHETILKKNLD